MVSSHWHNQPHMALLSLGRKKKLNGKYIHNKYTVINNSKKPQTEMKFSFFRIKTCKEVSDHTLNFKYKSHLLDNCMIVLGWRRLLSSHDDQYK